MATYKTPRKLSTEDAAYIAGLIDGEGTITLCRKHRNENRQLAVTISNTEKRLLQFELDAVGAGKITAKRTTRPHHTPSYRRSTCSVNFTPSSEATKRNVPKSY